MICSHTMFVYIVIVECADIDLCITGVTEGVKADITVNDDTDCPLSKCCLVSAADETRLQIDVFDNEDNKSINYTPQNPGLHYLYLYDGNGCSLYDRGLSVYG